MNVCVCSRIQWHNQESSVCFKYLEKSLLACKPSHPKKYLPNFPESKISTPPPKKSFDHSLDINKRVAEFTVICKISFSSLMFFGVTRSVCVYSTAERSPLACWQADKVLFLFSNVKTEKLQRGLVNSKIINSISLPKLQEFCNENAATWRPSLLQSRYSYIIKRLEKRLNQPMTATQIRIARSLKISHRN